MHISDQLIQTAQKGDPKSQKQLYMHCHAILLPIGRRYKVNDCDAVAVLNKTFIKILDKYTAQVGVGRFDAWSRRIMINQLIDDYRKTKNKRTSSTDDDRMAHLQDTWFSENEACISRLSYQELLVLIDELREPSRTVFNLFVIDGYTHEEIASKLEITSVNSRYHLSQAKKKLRHRLNHLMAL